LKIGNNPQLNDISALSSLTSVGGDILIQGTMLEDFSSLNFSRKTSVGGHLKITGNSLLKTLSGLEKMKSVEGDLVIDGNKKLTNLDGLPGLSYVNGRYIQIIENEKLNNNHAWVFINALKNSGRFNGNAVVQNQ